MQSVVEANSLLSQVRWGTVEEVEKQLVGRVSSFIDERDGMGYSALHRAAERSEGEGGLMVSLLLDKGASMNVKTLTSRPGTAYHGELTPLDVAVINGRSTIVQLLLDRGADVNLHANDAYKKALPSRMRESTSSQHYRQNGIPPDPSRTTGEETSLHHAVRFANPAIVQLLLDKGAHLEVKTKNGYTPLHRAVCEQLGELHAGPRGWVRRVSPSTMRCQLEVVQLLLDKGADIHARTWINHKPSTLARGGKTPEDLAKKLRNAEVLNPQPSTLNPQPSTLNNHQPSTTNPQPQTLNSQPSTTNPQPSTTDPPPSTTNPQPWTTNPQP